MLQAFNYLSEFFSSNFSPCLFFAYFRYNLLMPRALRIPIYTLVWVALAALYVPVFIPLYKSRWDQLDYTHAYFILPISLLLLWRRREELARLPIVENRAWVPLISIVLGLQLFLLGWRQNYLFVSTFSLIPVAWGLARYLYGPKIAAVTAFPIGYLLFLVPPPLGVLDSITLPMRQGVSIVTDLVLAAFEYPIERQGLLLSIGGQQIYLGEACSGFRSLITLAALGAVYIHLSRVRAGRKIRMALAIVPLALLGNLIRVIAVTLVTYYVGVNAGQKFFHDFSGFLIFVILIAGLLWIEHREE